MFINARAANLCVRGVVEINFARRPGAKPAANNQEIFGIVLQKVLHKTKTRLSIKTPHVIFIIIDKRFLFVRFLDSLRKELNYRGSIQNLQRKGNATSSLQAHLLLLLFFQILLL